MSVSKITVLFDEPFWIALFERTDGKNLEVCRIVFGAEPKDAEVYAFLLKNYSRLRFSPSVVTDEKPDAGRINPKRMRREISRAQSSGIGTKAQQALKKMYEENKLEKRKRRRSKKEADDKRRFELKKQKRKQKHRGK